MTDLASDAESRLAPVRRLRDEIREFHRDVRDAVIRHGLLIDEGLPELQAVNPKFWWPDLRAIFGMSY